ncbi:MAG: helix-turn-helix transcriptional regulator [Planctomycetota bacterium]|nr:helix-turn-helix transcriptional regulator [Planctomycetota bacterium]
MQYSFRLAELLGHVPDPRKRPGTVKAIVEYTGLDRHQVAALLKNEVKYLSLRALSRLCDYLVEHGYATADQLPGALFAVEAENYWELLARRQRVEICFGVRRTEDAGENPHGAWLDASDSLLMGELLNGISSLGGSAKMQPTATMDLPVSHSLTDTAPHPELLKQSLVWSPDLQNPETAQKRSRDVYDSFSQAGPDRALVGLGSVKSNPVIELIMASTFGCKPFHSQTNVKQPSERACPLMLSYREADEKPESCMAGTQLAKHGEPTAAGLHFERADGSWDVCQWNPVTEDAALVFYIHREALGRLEMVLGGFSGRSTRMLARTLSTRAEDFWPPVYSGQGVQIGAFIIHFAFNTPKQQQQDFLLSDPTGEITIIPLEKEVIRRRMEQRPFSGD